MTMRTQVTVILLTLLHLAWSRSDIVSVEVTNTGTRDTCGGILVTRYHVITSATCQGPDLASDFIVTLTQGKGSKRLSSKIGQAGNIILLSLSSPLPTASSQLKTIELMMSSDVRVIQQHSQSVKCTAAPPLGELTCRQGLVHVNSGWPVLDTASGMMVGFSNSQHQLDPVDIVSFGNLIAKDFASKYQSGEKRLIKCRRTENVALEFILVGVFGGEFK